MLSVSKKVKIVVTGNSGVGKTNTVRRIRNEEFVDFHESTSGVEFSSGVFMIKNRGDKKLVYIWDVSGKKEDIPLTSVFYQGADVIMMMFDITNKESFSALYILKDVIAESLYPNVLPQDKVLLLVGNKADLEERREVRSTLASSFAEEIGAHFLEISAKTGANFSEMTRILF